MSNLQEKFEGCEWFVMYYTQTNETQINVEFIAGYATQPSQEEVAQDSCQLAIDNGMTFEEVSEMKIHVLDKEGMSKIMESLN